MLRVFTFPPEPKPATPAQWAPPPPAGGAVPAADILQSVVTPEPPTAEVSPAPSARAAFDRAFPLVKRAEHVFLRQTGCGTQSRPAPILKPGGSALQATSIPGSQESMSCILLGLAATAVMAYFLKGGQRPDGSGWMGFPRAPIESSDFEVTAAALRSLAAVAPVPVKSTENAVFRLLRPVRAGAPSKQVAPYAGGGWSQLPALPSDVYATGEALYAFREARAVR